MRMLKSKVMSVAVVFGLFVSMMSAAVITINAIPIRRGDINEDSYVDTADVVALAKYLTGKQNYSADSCDVNGDGVADSLDLTNLITRVAGTIPSWWTTYREVYDFTADNEETVSYSKHNYITQTTTMNAYSITPTRGTPLINLTDDRIDYTDSAIVEIGNMVSGVFNAIGTGSIIGSNTVMTAAHVTGLSLYPNLAIRVANGTIYRVEETHMPTDYALNSDFNLDYALLKIKTNTKYNNGWVTITAVDLETTYGKINLGVMTDDKINYFDSYYLNNPSAPKHIAIPGYPSSSGGQLKIGWGNAYLNTTASLNDKNIFATVYVTGGQSGSPILYDIEGKDGSIGHRVAIGVCSFEGFVSGNRRFAQGPRMTAQLMSFYLNNPQV